MYAKTRDWHSKQSQNRFSLSLQQVSFKTPQYCSEKIYFRLRLLFLKAVHRPGVDTLMADGRRYGRRAPVIRPSMSRGASGREGPTWSRCVFFTEVTEVVDSWPLAGAWWLAIDHWSSHRTYVSSQNSSWVPRGKVCAIRGYLRARVCVCRYVCV